MKSSTTFFVNLVVAACAFSGVGAFSSASITTLKSRADPVYSRTSLAAATIGSSGDSLGAMPTKSQRSQSNKEQADLDVIKKELVQKYISLGHSEDYATNEVNYFLGDSERSAQYVEMRRIAMARGNDLGIETWVQFGAAFLVGWLVSWIANYLPTL